MEVNDTGPNSDGKQSRDGTRDARCGGGNFEKEVLGADSDDMFSEEEHCYVSKFDTPELGPLKSITNNVNSTSKIGGRDAQITPGKPFVPHTPQSLAPLISKCNQTWTSDMETPIAEDPKQQVVTPVDAVFNKINKGAPNDSPESPPNSSPVFMKKKRRPKRRIFTSSLMDQNSSDLLVEPLNQTAPSITHTEPVITTKSLLPANDPIDNRPPQTKPLHSSTTSASLAPPILNTSSQDFFANISFGNIDQIFVDQAASEPKRETALPKTDENTINILNQCRKKLKGRNQTMPLEADSIFLSQSTKDSADQELVSFRSTISKSVVPKMPSGVTATDLLSIIGESSSSLTNEFKKPAVVTKSSTVRKETEKLEDSSHMNVTLSATQVLAGCDLAEFLDDVTDWSVEVKSTKKQETDERREKSNENEKKEHSAVSGQSSESETYSTGFRTASGQNIPINEEALKKARQMYDDLSVSEFTPKNAKNLPSTSSNVLSTNFSTASGKSIFVDKNKLLRAQKSYDEMSSEVFESENDKSAQKSVISTPKMSTANEDELSLTLMFADECPSDFTSGIKTSNTNQGLPAMVESGFRTAGGTSISISEDKLSKAQQLYGVFFVDSETSESSLKTNVSLSKDKTQSGETAEESSVLNTSLNICNKIESEFKTASGTNISISAEKLCKAKQLYESLESKTDESVSRDKVSKITETSSKITETSEPKSPSVVESGFKSANGDSIFISEERGSNTQHLYNEIAVNSTPSNNTVQIGFSTASGSAININRDKLSQAKRMFDEMSELGQPASPSHVENQRNDSTFESSSSTVKLTTSITKKQKSQDVSSMWNQVIPMQKGLKRKWFSDTDIRSRLSDCSASNTPENCRKKSKSEPWNQSVLKKSISIDNCFDYDTDVMMMNMDIEELSDKENINPRKVGRFSTFPGASSFDEKVSQSLSLPEMNLRKRAIKNSMSLVMSQEREEEFLGFSEEEIQESVSSRERLEKLLRGYEGSSVSYSENYSQNFDLVNDITIPSSQLKASFSLDQNEVYFSEPSSEMLASPCKNVESSSESGSDVVEPQCDLYIKYLNKNCISGEYILRRGQLLESTASPPFLGFSPPDKSYVLKFSDFVERTIAEKWKDDESNNSSEIQVSPVFDYRPILNPGEKTAPSGDSVPNEADCFGGFRTAGGQPITVSKESLENARRRFEIDLDETSCPSEESVIGTFRTAGGKPITVSEESLKRAQRRFADDCSELDTVEAETKSEVDCSTSFGGFKTAGGQSIAISEESLKRARQQYTDDLSESPLNVEPRKKPETVRTPLLGGFKPLGGQINRKPRQSFNRAKQLIEANSFDFKSMKEIKSPSLAGRAKLILAEDSSSESVQPAKSIETATFGGFKTAAGDVIKVSEESLNRAKQRFADDIPDLVNVEPENSCEAVQTSSFEGFKTASGQPIEVSEESLKKARQILGGVTSDPIHTELKSEAFQTPTASGFNTASGEPIAVSEESLKKAKQLLGVDPSESNYIEPERRPEEHLTPSFGGFKTAGGQLIMISEESLKKANRMLEEVSSANLNPQHNSPSMRTPTSFRGFSTAAGEPIETSAESLQKAKRLLSDNLSDMTPELDKKCTALRATSFGEFKTAGGQAIPVSAEGLKRVKEIYREFDAPLNLPKATSRKLDTPLGRNQFQPVEFTSASGTPITVSSENLENANKILRESSNSSSGLESISKRKQSSSDSDTPFSTKNAAVKFKRPKFSADLLARKLFRDDDEKMQSASSGQEPKSGETNQPECPTSPIIGGQSRRSRHRRTMHSLRKIKFNETKESSGIEDKGVSSKRHSLPANFNQEVVLDLAGRYDTSENVVEDRQAASLLQDKIIFMKKRNRPKPLVGNLLRYRTENKHRRISWRRVSDNKPPIPKTVEEILAENMDPKILDITASNATSYSFHVSDIIGKDLDDRNVISVNLPDNVRLIINENGYATINEFRKAFLACPGVDPTLIPADWIDHHYGLIVWKLASVDRKKFGNAVMPRALTAARVMEELKYRYDREIDNSQRSAIRKIVEKDETSSKRMVLCVSSIKQLPEAEIQEKDKTPGQSSVMRKIEVTDGWYTIPITFDFPMLHYVTSGKIKVGTKIVTYGAELLGCERGCHPLERNDSMSLKIHTNSTRRARWDAKLGFQRNAEPFPVKLQHIDGNGGAVGKIFVVVSRIFPLLYREKTVDGQTIFRNARCEERAAATYEQECQNRMEQLYAKAEKDFQNIADSQGESQSDWDDRAVSRSRQAFALRQAKQEELKQRLERELRANLPPRRQVTPVLKIRVADEDTSALVTIWSGGEDVAERLKEGSCISIYNAIAYGRRSGELHLSFNSYSLFKTEYGRSIVYPGRTFTSVSDLQRPGFNPPYNEFDTVGIVASVTDAPRGMKNFQVVNLAYPADDDTSKYLSIYFWQGVSASGYGSIFVKGTVVACSNLEWRCSSSRIVPAGYYNEKTSFSCNPRQSHLREPFERLKSKVKNRLEYATRCAEEIAQEFEKMSAKMSNPGTPVNTSVSGSNTNTPATLNRSDGFTPARSSLVQRRLEYLARYGEAPSLSPIVLQSSSRVRSEFVPVQPNPK